MSSRYLILFAGFLAVAAGGSAQTLQRRATIVNNGRPGEAKCTLEVVVDGAAEIEIRGDTASLRNLKGQPPQWRRFECTAVMPTNPANFRFAGVDGRGRQQLMQQPDNGRPAVIQIDDPDNGSEGYTFDIMWGDMGQYSRGGQPEGRPYPAQPPVVVQERPYPGPPPVQGRMGGGRFFTEDAVSACQTYVRDQAEGRFNARDVYFRRTHMDDQPGRNDWVTGFFEARSPNGRPRNFQFSCSVDFDNGRVRTADIQLINNPMVGWGDAQKGRAIQACEASVERRLARDGFARIDFGSANVDDRPGRNDWIVGTVSTQDRYRPMWFDFSCSVDLRAGTVLDTQVNRRDAGGPRDAGPGNYPR